LAEGFIHLDNRVIMAFSQEFFWNPDSWGGTTFAPGYGEKGLRPKNQMPARLVCTCRFVANVCESRS